MTSVLTNALTKKVQSGDTREQWVMSRGLARRHLITREQLLRRMAMRAANGTKRKNECGDLQPCMYFFVVTHRKHSRRFGVKVLEGVVEARYTTRIEMIGRIKDNYGFRSPEGEQLLPGAQCAQGRQGETNSPGEAGRASDHHRSSGTRGQQEASVRGVELACVARTSEQRQPDRSGGFRFAGGTTAGGRAARVEYGTRGPVSADTPDFRIARSGARVALTIATLAVHSPGQTIAV